jgi:hypothetical protein
MLQRFSFMAALFIFILPHYSFADTAMTKRTTLVSNDRVNVWRTIVYPSENQILKPHHHDYDRVLVPYTDGVLKIVSDKGQSHLLTLVKGKAYYLTKDVGTEKHTDENMGTTPLEVVVIELKG